MAARGRGNRQHAARGLDAAIERQLAKQQHAGDVSPRDVSGGGEHAERDRKIERRPGLSDVSGREVHRDAMRRKLEPGIPDGTAHAVAAFPDAGVRKPNHLKRRQAEGDVDLYLHEAGFYPEDGGGSHAGKHRIFRECKTAVQ